MPLTPRLVGTPGIGKTSLAIAGARTREQELYIYQCTADTRPEDLLIVDWEKGQGWKELCSFLNKSVPNVSFPHDNRGNNTELSRAKWLFYRMYYFINERYKNYV